MQDEILKKIYENVNGALSNDFNEYETNVRQSSNNLAVKDAVVKDLCLSVTDTLNKMLAAASAQEKDKQASFLETGIKSLIMRLNDYATKAHDEAVRASGIALGVEASSKILTKGFAYHEKEVATARDVIARQQEGDLTKKKIGDRPVKLKDVRNYATSDKID